MPVRAALLLLLGAGLAWCQAGTLSMNAAVFGSAGGNVTADITFAAVSGQAAGLEWIVRYDPAATSAIGLAAGAAAVAAGKTIACAPPYSGVVHCLISGGTAAIGNGVIATVTVTLARSSSQLALGNPIGSTAAGNAFNLTAYSILAGLGATVSGVTSLTGTSIH